LFGATAKFRQEICQCQVTHDIDLFQFQKLNDKFCFEFSDVIFIGTTVSHQYKFADHTYNILASTKQMSNNVVEMQNDYVATSWSVAGRIRRFSASGSSNNIVTPNSDQLYAVFVHKQSDSLFVSTYVPGGKIQRYHLGNFTFDRNFITTSSVSFEGILEIEMWFFVARFLLHFFFFRYQIVF
jgi:hypothetical protein